MIQIRAFVILVFSFFIANVSAANDVDVLTAPSITAKIDIQPAPPGRLPWVVFDERSGLPQNTIVDLITDQNGFVWAATQDGAARYNGRVWETLALPKRIGSNYPRVMRSARDGGLWIGSFDGGLAYYRDGKWSITDVSDGLPSNRIRGLLETSTSSGSNVLWIATDRGVARMQDGKITSFGKNSGLPSLDTEGLCETTEPNGQHILLVGTANGLARFSGDHFVTVPIPKQWDPLESTCRHASLSIL